VPCKNSRCFALLDPFEHFIEDRSPRFLGGLLFDKRIDDDDALSRSEFTGFGELIFDRTDLAFGIVRRFSGVEKTFSIDVVHADTLARKRVGAKKKVFHKPARWRAVRFHRDRLAKFPAM
jgi:hypothetical protein